MSFGGTQVSVNLVQNSALSHVAWASIGFPQTMEQEAQVILVDVCWMYRIITLGVKDILQSRTGFSDSGHSHIQKSVQQI